MTLIVCADDKNGVGFHNRRQSKDRTVIQNMLDMVGEKKLYVKPYSAPLFEGYKKAEITEHPRQTAGEEDYIFLEKESIDFAKEKAVNIIVYRWNRVYPSDVFLKISEDFILCKKEEWNGFSHEKITKEIYVRTENL